MRMKILLADKNINAGELNKLVTIQGKTVAQDSFGEEVVTWTKIADVWASINPVSYRELLEAQQVQSEISHRIVIRYRDGIKPYHQIIYGNSTYEILNIFNPNTANIALHLICRELVR